MAGGGLTLVDTYLKLGGLAKISGVSLEAVSGNAKCRGYTL